LVLKSFHLHCRGWFDAARRVAEFKAAVADQLNITISAATVREGKFVGIAGAAPFRIIVDFDCLAITDLATLTLIQGSDLTL
jgi:hypothetical protein